MEHLHSVRPRGARVFESARTTCSVLAAGVLAVACNTGSTSLGRPLDGGGPPGAQVDAAAGLDGGTSQDGASRDATTPPSSDSGDARAPDQDGATVPTSRNFQVRDGKIYDPAGNRFVARGINVYDEQQGTVCSDAACHPLTTLFPGLNFIRLPVFSYYDPSYFQTFVARATALKIVVEIEHHVGAGGGVAPLTGQALADESHFFATLAAAFKDNAYVWFGTLNEPGGPGDVLTAQQVSNYDAIRGAGNDNIVMMEIFGDYDTGKLTIGNGHGLVASSYATMKNIVWDLHYYNWLSNYSADQTTNDDQALTYIAQAQTISSADGTVPVLIGEYGISTDGQATDTGGVQTCIAAQRGGATSAGSAAWHWYSYGTSDNLTDGNAQLTSYGTQVASFVNAP